MPGTSLPKTHSDSSLPQTKSGRLYARYIHDLFSTLVVSMNLKANRQFFKVYPNSFTSDKALTNVASLKFSQSTRYVDAHSVSKSGRSDHRVKTTTTTTTFSMTKDAAKGVLQQMVDAKLMENAADLSSTAFKERAIWVLSPKGLDVLERFITRQGIYTPSLNSICSAYPAGPQPIVYLERSAVDDAIVFDNQPMIEEIFRRFVGKAPRAHSTPRNPYQNSLTSSSLKRASGSRGSFSSELSRQSQQSTTSFLENLDPDHLVSTPGINLRRHKSGPNPADYCFDSIPALDWLGDFTSSIGYDEAGQMAALWVALGWIECVSTDVTAKSLLKEKSFKVSSSGRKTKTVDGLYQTSDKKGEFRASEKTVYKVTSVGTTLAWKKEQASTAFNPYFHRDSVLSSESISTVASSAKSVQDGNLNFLNVDKMPVSPPPTVNLMDRNHLNSANNPTIRAPLRSATQFSIVTPPSIQQPIIPSRTNISSSPNVAQSPPPSGTKTPTATNGSDIGAKPPRYIPFSHQNPGVSIIQTLKDSRAAKLYRILEEPVLRGLFRDFMRLNICEENLNFWCDIEDLKRRYRMSSSAVRASSSFGMVQGRPMGESAGGKTGISGQMAKHQQELLELAKIIYTTYLAPRSEAEINVPSLIRKEIISYLTFIERSPDQQLVYSPGGPIPFYSAFPASRGGLALPKFASFGKTGKAGQPGLPTGVSGATQLQKIMGLYEAAQKLVFEGMAADSLPKFVKNDRIARVLRNVTDFEGSQSSLFGTGSSKEEPFARSATPTRSSSSTASKPERKRK